LHDLSFFHGPFSLQHGAGLIKFRKVQIKPLPSTTPPKSPYFNNM
jgi:hypothetical protein